MRKALTVTLLLIASSLLIACGAGPSQEPATSAAEPATPQTETATAAPTMVEVSETGTYFDPPVNVDQIPVGAWYCDMGTVHYATLEPGDGTCQTCGMALVQKVDEPVAEEGVAVEPPA